MRIEQMQHFITIYEEKTFNRASNKLMLAQQTLSNSIKSIETELGAELFIRSHKGVTLTPEGEIAYKFFKEFLKLYDKFYTEIHAVSNVEPISFSVATIVGPERTILPELQCELFLNYPNINLTVYRKDIQQIIDAVFNKKIDLGLISLLSKGNETLFSQLQDRSIVTLPLKRWTPYAWVSKKSSLSKKEKIDIKVIRKYPIIVYEQSETTLKTQSLKLILGDTHTPQYYNNIKTIANLTEANSFLFLDWYSENYGLDFEVYFKGKNVKAIPIVFDEDIYLDTVALFHSSCLSKPYFDKVIKTLQSQAY